MGSPLIFVWYNVDYFDYLYIDMNKASHINLCIPINMHVLEVCQETKLLWNYKIEMWLILSWQSEIKTEGTPLGRWQFTLHFLQRKKKEFQFKFL